MLDVESVDCIKAMVFEFYKKADKDGVAEKGFAQLKEGLEKQTTIIYAAVDGGVPAGYFAVKVGEDEQGKYLFLWHLFSNVTWLAGKLLGCVAEIAKSMELPRVIAVCDKPQTVRGASRYGYTPVSTTIELQVPFKN